MLRYIARRLLIFFPTLFIILLISFLISRGVPGDPVYNEMDGQYQRGGQIDAKVRTKEYLRISHEMGLDLPVFYFSLSSAAYPDTLYRIPVLNERENLQELVGTYGNWEEISAYFHYLEDVERQLQGFFPPPGQKQEVLDARRAIEELQFIPAETEIQYRLDLLDSLVQTVPVLRDSFALAIGGISQHFEAVKANATPWKLYLPTFHVYGFKNQFHHWIMGMLQGNFGRSYDERRPVTTMILEALPWTIFMGFLSFSISYFLAIPIGVYSVRKRNQWQDGTITLGLFLLHSIPTFVAAMLLMTFFCNQDYLQIFPTSGVASDGSELWPWHYRMLDHAYHLILPTLVFSYGSIAFVSRQLRVGMLENLNMDYVRTARAKGLPEKVVIWKHTLRNSLLPLITHISALLPAMVSGALITEYIFSIPGMGLLTANAMFSYDHPVIIAIFTITATATLTGLLISDILYALADPRITYTRK
jgi:peptide/nickel transport system permease protein